jgi:hypothetical protein
MEMLVLVIVGIAVAVAVTQSSKRKVSEAWRQAASQLRIHHNAGDFFTKPELYGLVQGCRVKVTIRAKNQGHATRKSTRYEVNYKQALPFGLRLTEQSAFSSLKRLLGGHDMEVGDPNFDDFVVVFGHDTARVREFLNPARRLYVRRILSLYSGAEITDSCIKWDSNGVENESQTLVSNVKRIVDFALSMEVESNEHEQHYRHPEPSSIGSGSKRTGVGLEAILHGTDGRESLEMSVDSVPTVPDPATSQLSGPDTAPEMTSESAPSEQIVEQAGGTQTVAASDPESPAVEQAGSTRSEEPTAVELCSSLFGSNMISFQIDELFSQRYAGLEVRWEGKLTRADYYPFDLVFGRDPGTKAEFEIVLMPDDSFGSRAVKAVVQLSPGAHETLRSRTGDTMDFTGTLVRCDSFTRVLFVAHGRLLE